MMCNGQPRRPAGVSAGVWQSMPATDPQPTADEAMRLNATQYGVPVSDLSPDAHADITAQGIAAFRRELGEFSEDVADDATETA